MYINQTVLQVNIIGTNIPSKTVTNVFEEPFDVNSLSAEMIHPDEHDYQ